MNECFFLVSASYVYIVLRKSICVGKVVLAKTGGSEKGIIGGHIRANGFPEILINVREAGGWVLSLSLVSPAGLSPFLALKATLTDLSFPLRRKVGEKLPSIKKKRKGGKTLFGKKRRKMRRRVETFRSHLSSSSSSSSFSLRVTLLDE